jgi:hypothetical protein
VLCVNLFKISHRWLVLLFWLILLFLAKLNAFASQKFGLMTLFWSFLGGSTFAFAGHLEFVL